MRIAGSTLVYSTRPLPEALQGLHGLGFSHVDLATIEGWAHINPADIAGDARGKARQTGRLLKEVGLAPLALNAGLGDGPLSTLTERFEALAAFAEELGAGVITVNSARKESPLEGEFERFRAFVPLAEKHRVQLTVETHYFCHTEDPDVAVRYCEEVPGLGLTLDPSHYAAGPYWEDGFDQVLPYVKHLHARGAGRSWDDVQMPAGEGVIDYADLIGRLVEAGYTGDVSVEYVDSMPGVDHAREAGRMRKVLEKLV